MSRIDETSRRRPGFTAGVAVVLADGQEWSFALPRLRLTPRRSGDGFTVAVARVGLPDYERWDAVRDRLVRAASQFSDSDDTGAMAVLP